MPVLNQNQETAMETALGLPTGRILIAQMNAATQASPGGPPGQPLVNNTPPTYVAAPDYAETIDGMRVTYLTVGTV